MESKWKIAANFSDTSDILYAYTAYFNRQKKLKAHKIPNLGSELPSDVIDKITAWVFVLLCLAHRVRLVFTEIWQPWSMTSA